MAGPQVTGRAIDESIRVGFQKMMEPGFGVEMIYSFVIITCSLMIYFGTKELYELSNHKGIKYFRISFMFFAIAHILRSVIKFITINLNIPRIIDVNPMSFYFGLGSVTLFVYMYLSSMAIFYLLYSVMWKKWSNNDRTILIFHGLALVISVISTIFTSSLVYFGINLFLLAFVIATFRISKKQNRKKKSNGLHVIYSLMFLFWSITIIDILIPDFFQTFQMLIYLASSGIFLAMLYKVLRKTGAS